ncbi:MAG: sulfate adenylyltransferase [Candidatus Aminicenantes bacterium]|nr:sulfate adenylyltransferase [Candidatus Aminicenantes bacterium]
MIKPHGSDVLNPLFVRDEKQRNVLIKEAELLPSVMISSAAAANAVMLGSGYFNPLPGYMNLEDALQVAENMQTSGGLFWPVPILNLLDSAEGLSESGRLALRDPNVEGNPVLAIQEIDAIETMTEDQKTRITEKVFGTLDPEHPGVGAFLSQGRVVVSGPIQVLNFSYFKADFGETFRTAYQIRQKIETAGWEKVVAFQTRNPMHRAHEELCKMAKEAVGADGILIHMLLGKLKAGDIPADVRDASIRKMVELYFPPNTVLITGYGFDMLYAGPREAVLHAIFRQNCGCTHLIVGRDHAGVGSYYGPFDAQKIFRDQVPPGALGIDIFEADHTAWSKKLNRVVMMNSVSDHSKEDWVFLSGTKVREMLSNGESLPEEFSRPEVAEILGQYYRSLAGA